MIILSLFLSLSPVSLACGCSSQSRNGSSWQSSRLQSASSAWLRSVCTRLRITGDYCCWPRPRATPTWWANWPRGRRRMGRPTWPSSPTSCREGEQRKLCLNPDFNQLFQISLLYFCTSPLFCICPGWTNVWSFSSKQIGYQRLHFWQEHICPARCQGKVVSIECTAYA